MFIIVLTLHILSAIAGIGVTIFMATLGPRVAGSPDAPIVMKYAGANASTVGPLALVVLWITGGWLAWGYGLADAGGIWFQVKIALVLVLTMVVGFGQMVRFRIARGADPRPLLAAMRRVQPVGSVVAILVVVAAVLAFR